MASKAIVDIEPFLQPITEDNPAGSDLRAQNDADFATVKAARRKIVSLTKAARFDQSLEGDLSDQWKIIRKLAPSILKKKSKDLEVAAWFAESLLKLDGFPGIRDGFAIIGQLVENFWDNLYPTPDEDGLETRIYPIISLNGEEGTGTLVLPLKNTTMMPDSETLLSFTSLTRIRSILKLDDPSERESRLAELGINPQILQGSIDVISSETARELVGILEHTLTNWKKIGQLIDQKCEEAGSSISLPMSGVNGSLEEVEELYRQILHNQLNAEPAQTKSAAPDDNAAELASANVSVSNAGVSSPAQSREDAIKQLHTIAGYFRSTEPHSPIAGIIERAAQWAQLPLPQLLAELIPDAGARMHYSLMTGIEIGAEVLTENEAVTAPTPKSQIPSSNTGSASSNSDWNF